MAPSTASFRLEDDVTLFASSSAIWPVERCVATIILLQTSTQQMSECKPMHRQYYTMQVCKQNVWNLFH